MRLFSRGVAFNNSQAVLSILAQIKRNIDNFEVEIDELSQLRKLVINLISTLGSKSKLEGIDIEIDTTGIIIQVSHSDAARSKILDALLHIDEGKIDSFVYITQTKEAAITRNRVKKPNTKSTGNRVYFEDLCVELEKYSTSFISSPCGIIGFDIL